MAHVVGSKGQVVIAKEIRDRLGVEPGWVALQRLAGDHVEVYFVPPEHRKSLKGSLAKHVKVHIASGQEWDKARDIAWEKAAKRKIGTGEQTS
jgi:bifunctional DNA-binding transcriptional regulator/antitoxin component of YhaV-PrlF toxin-antitoxin module